MSGKRHYCDSKYEKAIADKLRGLDKKIHYKLYMLWANNPTLPSAAIADAMGVSRQAFTKYIREEKPLVPDIYKLFRLSKQFNIPLHYFTDDNIECMENPTDCTIPDSYVEDVNTALIPALINAQLDIERKDGENRLNLLLRETGLDHSLIYRLTDKAYSELSDTLKNTVTALLSDKTNINEPENPIDPNDFE